MKALNVSTSKSRLHRRSCSDTYPALSGSSSGGPGLDDVRRSLHTATSLAACCPDGIFAGSPATSLDTDADLLMLPTAPFVVGRVMSPCVTARTKLPSPPSALLASSESVDTRSPALSSVVDSILCTYCIFSVSDSSSIGGGSGQASRHILMKSRNSCTSVVSHHTSIHCIIIWWNRRLSSAMHPRLSHFQSSSTMRSISASQPSRTTSPYRRRTSQRCVDITMHPLLSLGSDRHHSSTSCRTLPWYRASCRLFSKMVASSEGIVYCRRSGKTTRLLLLRGITRLFMSSKRSASLDRILS
eukprot:PhM_4_TR15787/c0_g1_i1/m.100733